jgi:phosphohistidine phosphatase
MLLTIWRHGEAGRAPTDRLRELTDKGFDDIGFGCRQFHAALAVRGLPPPDRIFFSPWVRTLETAEIIASAFTHARSSEMAALRPGGTLRAAEAALEAASTGLDHVLLVSHQPLVSRLVEHFLGVDNAVPVLSPGGFATLSLEVIAAACGELRFWAVAPEYEVGM